jgi:hypothetical protein
MLRQDRVGHHNPGISLNRVRSVWASLPGGAILPSIMLKNRYVSFSMALEASADRSGLLDRALTRL